jgi:hypothetical protein
MDAVIHDGDVQARRRVRDGEIESGTSNESAERAWDDFFRGSVSGRRVCFGLPQYIIVIVGIVCRKNCVGIFLRVLPNRLLFLLGV